MMKRISWFLIKFKFLLPLTVIVILVYKYFLDVSNLKDTECSEKLSTNNEHPTAFLNLKRIKMFYSNSGDFFIPSCLKKKDWHNYSQIELDKQKVGLGEQGKPTRLLKDEENEGRRLFSKYGYNALLSDKIQLNRSLPDVRHTACNKRLYLKSLPTVSVVIPFRNEHWSTLLRTLHSILNRSPEHLIKEIFLVDDASEKDFLMEGFDIDVQKSSSKVSVFHLGNRSGIVGARLAGAKAATAHVLIFLDSHIEANVNWLPPLLEPIALDYKTVVVPIIDRINYDTFEYIVMDNGRRGSFDWELTYQRLLLTPKDEENLPEPFETPVMTGGLFAISRRFFWELGGYDPNLHNWGGDEFELSFKIWQCGGQMLEAPCSRFGHINHFYNFPDHDIYTARNFRRVVEVWMDEYAQYVYARRPGDKKVDPGDLTEQKALRNKLKCKPFKWYITQIAFDLTQQNPLVEPLPYAEGRIRPTANLQLCVDGNHGEYNDALVLRPCHPKHLQLPRDQDDQTFELTSFNDVKLKSRFVCWDLKKRLRGSHVTLFYCHRNGGNEQWRYYEDSKQFIFWDKLTPICLDHNPKNYDLFISLCDNKSHTQRWKIDTVYKERMAAWNVNNTNRVTGPTEEWAEKD